MAVNVEEVKFQITAQDAATRVFKSLQGAVGSLQSQYIALGAAVAGGAVLTKFLSDAIATRSALDDLADTTGDNVKTLDGLRRIANVAGVDMDRLGGALTKLAKNMNSADDDGKAAGEAIKSIGLDIESLRAKKPGEAFFEIAMALSKFEDGAAKVAVAQALMGKEGAKMLPLMKDMAEEGQLNGRITTEQAAAAEALEKSYRRLNQQYIDGKDALATELIPWLTRMIDEMREGIRITGSFGAALMNLGTINPFRSVRGNIATLQAGIAEREQASATMSRLPGYAGAISANEMDNNRDRERIEYLKYLERQEALRGSSGDSPGERARMGATRARLDFKVPARGGGAAGGERTSAFDTLKRQMEDQLAKVGELTEFEKLLATLQQDRYAKLSEAQRGELINLAAALDISKEDARLKKEIEEVLKRHTEETDRQKRLEAERLNTLAAKYKDLADPLEKYRKELEDINELQQMGYLTAAQALEAAWAVNERLDAEFNKLTKPLEETNDLAKELGLTFSSAFEDAIVGGKKFSEVLRSLAQDVLKMFVRDQLTKPLANAAGELFKSFDWGSLFKFKAEGGPVSANTPYIVGEKGPELFMPSASGNIVPNHQLGSGGSTYVIDARGADRAGLARLESMIQRLDGSIEYRAVSAVAERRQRGGAFSGAMGR